MVRSSVVTGGGRGIGRAIVDRLLADGHAVTVIEHDREAADRLVARLAIKPVLKPAVPTGNHLQVVVGDAADETVAAQAVQHAQAAGTFSGWVNNAAVFRDATLHTAPASEILGLIAANLAPVVVGAAAAVRGFRSAGTRGAIVNVSSHQAQRPVRGALPYATAKAAIEGLTRSLAVDYGPEGIRTNAVALGSIVTERYDSGLDDALARLHPLGRPGTVEEVAAAVAYLLSDDAAFVNGAILPIDGGRSVYGPDPEETRPGN
jgi:NAD(P)-dependent dehydrogenase (short-subunit alcohol dehydrogenase family)